MGALALVASGEVTLRRAGMGQTAAAAKVDTISNKAANASKKTGNPVQKQAQAKANPGGSSSGGGKGSSKSGGSSGASARGSGGTSSGGGKKASDGEGDTCNSFVPGTKVLMADGSTKRIEDVKTGDKVKATDPKTGETRVETVTAEITGKGLKNLVRITIDLDGKHGSKSAKITATDGHPFWVPALKEWIRATDLRAGQTLRTSAGTYVQLSAIERWTARKAAVHNLTVSDLHTYYVLAGAAPVLVHNCGSGDSPAPSMANKPYGPMPQAGRRGSTATRDQLDDVRDEMLGANPDWVHSAGGRNAADGSKLPERAVNNPGGPGRRFPDLTFDLPDGSQFYVNTVDTYKNGAATTRELAAALDITAWGSGPVLMIPKL